MPANYDGEAAAPSPGPGLLTALRRHPLIVVVTIVLAAAIGALITFALPVHYVATARVVLGNPNALTAYRTVPVPNATAQAQNAAQIMRSQPVYDRAAEIIGRNVKSGAVANHVDVAPGEENNPLVTIRGTANNAKRARDFANALGQAYLDVTNAEDAANAKRATTALTSTVATVQAQLNALNKQAAAEVAATRNRASGIRDATDRARYVESALAADPVYTGLKSQVSSVAGQLDDVKEKLQQTRTDTALLRNGPDTLYEASTPNKSSSSDYSINVAIAAVLGLLLGAALAWRRLDRERGLAPETVAALLGAPQLGRLRRERELRTATRVVDLTRGRRLSDDLRVLASSLLLALRRQGLAGAVITSALPGEGRTVLALNLCAAAASAGHDVVLVDADVRRPVLSAKYDLREPGLLERAATPLTATLPARDVTGGLPVPMLPIGAHAGEGAAGLPALRRPDGSAPVALVDSPAVFDDPLALWLAAADGPLGTVDVGGAHAGLVVVVTSATTADDLRTLRARADLAGAAIIGFVANARRGGRSGDQRRGAAAQPRDERPDPATRSARATR